ncbi:MAG: hypothetical protein ACLGPM_05250 [Acidobacteriota bacterium]
MNDRDELEKKETGQPADEQPKGPSLALLYTLLAIALLTATALAAMIVLPFYQHRH